MYERSKEKVRESVTFLGAGVSPGLCTMAGSISLDIWTSRANKAYMCVLLHTCSSRFALAERCIGMREFDDITPTTR